MSCSPSHALSDAPYWQPCGGSSVQQPDVTFNDARRGLLQAMAEQEGLDLLALVREYNRNAEFKRRIDLAALSLISPTPQAVH